jgi:soluble lytic murein transglycosylase-like protein
MTPLVTLFTAFSLQYGLPPGLLSSLCYVESKHKVSAMHHDDGGENSIGVCQIKLSTAKDLGFKGTEKDLMNPKRNIHYAAKYLSKQVKRYNGSIEKAVIAYNIGHAGTLTSTKYQVKVFTKWRHK